MVERLVPSEISRSVQVLSFIFRIYSRSLLFYRTGASASYTHADCVTVFILVSFRFIFRICRTVKLGWVIIWVPFYSLPIGSDKASGLLKVGCIVQVLLTPLDLSLHATACLAPFSKVGSRFFIASLVSQLSVFVLPPDLFELLLFQIVRRMIHEVI